MPSGGCFPEFCKSVSNVDRVPFQNNLEMCFHPCSKTISFLTRRLPRYLIISLRRDTAISDVQERDCATLAEYNCTRVSGEAMVSPIFPRRPKYCEFRRASKLVRQVLQLLATKISVQMRCPKASLV